MDLRRPLYGSPLFYEFVNCIFKKHLKNQKRGRRGWKKARGTNAGESICKVGCSFSGDLRLPLSPPYDADPVNKLGILRISFIFDFLKTQLF